MARSKKEGELFFFYYSIPEHVSSFFNYFLCVLIIESLCILISLTVMFKTLMPVQKALKHVIPVCHCAWIKTASYLISPGKQISVIWGSVVVPEDLQAPPFACTYFCMLHITLGVLELSCIVKLFQIYSGKQPISHTLREV